MKIKMLLLAAVLYLPLLYAADHTGAAPRRPLVSAPVQFLAGAQAELEMYNLTNAVIDWRTMVQNPATLAGYFQTNQILTAGWHPIAVRISTPLNEGKLTPNGSLSTFQRLFIEFAQPVAAIGLYVQTGTRFGWTFNVEALDAGGTSLGNIQQSGYTQTGTTPAVFVAAVAQSDRISSIRVVVPSSGLPQPGADGLFTAGMVQFRQTPLSPDAVVWGTLQ